MAAFRLVSLLFPLGKDLPGRKSLPEMELLVLRGFSAVSLTEKLCRCHFLPVSPLASYPVVCHAERYAK